MKSYKILIIKHKKWLNKQNVCHLQVILNKYVLKCHKNILLQYKKLGSYCSINMKQIIIHFFNCHTFFRPTTKKHIFLKGLNCKLKQKYINFFCRILNVLSNMKSMSLHSGKEKMIDVIMETMEKDLPSFMSNILSYASNPGLIISAVLLMVWVVT